MYKTSNGMRFIHARDLVKAHLNGQINLTEEVEHDELEVEVREVYVTLNYEGWSIEVPVHELRSDHNWASHQVFARDFSCKYGILIYEWMSITIGMDLNVDMWGDFDFDPPDYVDIKWPESIEVDDSTVWETCSFEKLNEALEAIGVVYHDLPDVIKEDED